MDAFADPFAHFNTWFAEAQAAEPNDPNGMALASVDGDGLPNLRMVLMKAFGPDGLVFYTNFESAKGRELLAQPKAAALFHWKSLRRQVRLRGPVSVVSEAEADAYFASRPRDSRIGAWASAQSRPLQGRFELEAAVAKFAARYAIGDVPRPPHWSGFRLMPIAVEFWADRPFRLHDRLVYSRNDDGGWRTERLYP
jgi:pyridoxamine 5'-phosphate oxidase